MFLIVFVTLVVSVIGLYAQVLSLQAAQAHNAQVGLMQTMMTWHGAATDFAMANPPGTVGILGCTLSESYNAGVNTTPCASVMSQTAAAPLLPAGYNFQNFTFTSTAFQNGVQLYVITYVHDTKSPGYSDPSQDLLLPAQGGAEVGYSLNDLREQFNRSAPIYLTYGTVTSTGKLTVNVNYSLAGTNYNTMTYDISPSIPVNSLAIISVAQ